MRALAHKFLSGVPKVDRRALDHSAGTESPDIGTFGRLETELGRSGSAFSARCSAYQRWRAPRLPGIRSTILL